MKQKIFLAALASLALFSACNKESRIVPVQILLTDKPTSLEEVNVEITGINVKLSSDTSGWIALDTKAGVYNLLALQNGTTAVLANGTVPDGILTEIRFVLGNNNTIKEGGQVKPLVIPSGSESGLKVKIDKGLKETLNTFVLDFDSSLSVKEESDGYKLRPVIRLK